MVTRRADHKVVAIGPSQFMAIGGIDKMTDQPTNSCEFGTIHEDGSIRWTRAPPMREARSRFAATVTFDGKRVVVFGNGRINPRTRQIPANNFSMECFDVETKVWTRVAINPNSQLNPYDSFALLSIGLTENSHEQLILIANPAFKEGLPDLEKLPCFMY